MKKKRNLAGILLVAVMALTVTAGCSKLDVVGNQSITSFEAILEVIPENISADPANKGWSLLAPDGSARFIWSENYSASPRYDVMLEIDAAPFINAGLDPGKLPAEQYTYDDDTLLVGAKLGGDELTYDGDPTPLAAYEQIVRHYRSAIAYHTALDHYNITIGDGNLFEWAKDMQTNGATGENQDKDIVFVLNPEPLIAAGAVPDQVDGWTYTTVSVDMGGKATELYKFLKPFDLQ